MKKLMRLVEAGEKTAFVKTAKGEKMAIDYKNSQELKSMADNSDIKAIKTATGDFQKGTFTEEKGRQYTTQESAAVGKAVAKSLVKVLRGQGDEVVNIKLTGVGANKFNIHVTYGNDKGQDTFKFKLNPESEDIHIETQEGDQVLTDFLITQGNTVSFPTPELESKLADIMKKYVSEPNPEQYDQMAAMEPESDPSQINKPISEKKLTKPELKKREEIVKAMKKDGAPKSSKTYAIATAQAKKVAEAARPDYLDLDNDKNTKEPMKKAAQDKKRAMKEDLDIGHQDDEPGMLLGDLYSIMKSTKELYQIVSQFEGQQEVDFPHWWQAKIIKAKSCLQAANQYLDYEVNKPQQAQKVRVVALQEKKGTCCHKCGHVHVKGEAHPTPYLTGKKSCEFRKVNETSTPQDVTATTGKPKTSTPGDVAALAKAQQSATTVQTKSKNINNITEFPGAFEQWMGALGLEPAKATRGSIEAQVRKVLTKLGYK